MPETKLKKTQYIPFIDVSDTINTNSWLPVWKRIDRSTIFSLNPNPQTEDMDYISYETPMTEVDHYQPELPQEIALYEGNDVYDFAFKKFYNLPVGSDAIVPILCVFGAVGDKKPAWQVKQCTFTLGELNTPDGKLSFTLNMGGDIEKGSVTASAEGFPTFTAKSYYET